MKVGRGVTGAQHHSILVQVVIAKMLFLLKDDISC